MIQINVCQWFARALLVCLCMFYFLCQHFCCSFPTDWHIRAAASEDDGDDAKWQWFRIKWLIDIPWMEHLSDADFKAHKIKCEWLLELNAKHNISHLFIFLENTVHSLDFDGAESRCSIWNIFKYRNKIRKTQHKLQRQNVGWPLRRNRKLFWKKIKKHQELLELFNLFRSLKIFCSLIAIVHPSCKYARHSITEMHELVSQNERESVPSKSIRIMGRTKRRQHGKMCKQRERIERELVCVRVCLASR